jgi:hypothetical protein
MIETFRGYDEKLTRRKIGEDLTGLWRLRDREM